MKRCGTCKIEKPLDEFHKHRGMADGRQNSCKMCRNEIKRLGIATKNQPSKVCTGCETEKPLTEFFFRKDRWNYEPMCKKCSQERRTDWRISQRHKKTQDLLRLAGWV